MSCEFKIFLENSLCYKPATVLINNYFSQYNEQIIANVSILSLSEKFDLVELVTIIVDMHINLCHLIIRNAKVNLPCINGHFDGIIFNSKLTEINHNLQKKEVFNYLKKMIKGFETHSNIFKNSDFVLYRNLITDPEHDDIIVHVSSRFLSFLDYSNEELMGKNPKVLQYPNLNAPNLINQCPSDFGNKIRQNKTALASFRNFRKNGEIFDNTIIVKTIMAGTIPLYRFSLQMPYNNVIDEHAWKSYLDNVFVINEPPLFSTIYSLKNDRFKLINLFNFEEVINSDEFTDSLHIEDVIKLQRSGSSKLYNVIYHLKSMERTITLEHDFMNNGKTFHLQSVLYINKVNDKMYVFAVHREK
jgi:hypothetical protein